MTIIDIHSGFQLMFSQMAGATHKEKLARAIAMAGPMASATGGDVVIVQGSMVLAVVQYHIDIDSTAKVTMLEPQPVM